MLTERQQTTLLDRFISRVRVESPGCWIWTGPSKDGYGRFRLGDRCETAHRASWRLLVGEIPAGLHIDHLCRVKRCVNPDHLEPVTPAENTARARGGPQGHYAATCGDGHFSPENTYVNRGKRYCRKCSSKRSMAYLKRRKARAAAAARDH